MAVLYYLGMKKILFAIPFAAAICSCGLNEPDAQVCIDKRIDASVVGPYGEHPEMYTEFMEKTGCTSLICDKAYYIKECYDVEYK